MSVRRGRPEAVGVVVGVTVAVTVAVLRIAVDQPLAGARPVRRARQPRRGSQASLLARRALRWDAM